MELIPPSFQVHYANWLRASAAAAQAAACQRWENEGGALRPARNAPGDSR